MTLTSRATKNKLIPESNRELSYLFLTKCQFFQSSVCTTLTIFAAFLLTYSILSMGLWSTCRNGTRDSKLWVYNVGSVPTYFFPLGNWSYYKMEHEWVGRAFGTMIKMLVSYSGLSGFESWLCSLFQFSGNAFPGRQYAKSSGSCHPHWRPWWLQSVLNPAVKAFKESLVNGLPLTASGSFFGLASNFQIKMHK